MELTAFLNLMAQKNASDLFLSAGAPPSIKIEGLTRHIGEKALGAEEIRNMAYSIMNERQMKDFEATWEMNLAIALGDLGRFRVNVYRQRGEIAMAVRFITNKIPSIESLNLPQVLKDIIMLPRGLVLVVGSTGSGKSTTLASMIDYRNENRTGHILTVEEPIEYVHTHKMSVVDQREIGLDTQSYANALKNAMREAPDVIMIGEIRDRETMQAAIAYAETGHLCLATLHANNANQTLDRIINFFPEAARHQLLIDLSLNLKAVIGQRLLKGVKTKRVPAIELLLSSAYISDLIEKGEIATIREAMKQGNEQGMQTFDQALYKLYAAGEITYQEALENADSRTDLSLKVRLEGPAPQGGEAAGLRLEDLQDMLVDPSHKHWQG
ncbi:MAG TPA: type IV pili twitching motility protein PilT [Arenimonas sp.]|nr:MAG: type IV pili twitching motility protein PilT [Xanthomonadales bacterium GWF1_69_6]HBD20345.1 type IV pili twitching motility protein PilT [Arenimonas sp.]